MKPKSKKSSELQQIQHYLQTFPTVLICAFEGIKVVEDFELRKRIRSSGGKYRVVQNRLAQQAAQGTPFEQALSKLRGMTSLAFADDDPVSLVKALVAYAKDHPVFQFKAGVVEGRALDVAGLNQLATLPGRADIYARLLSLINAPAQRVLQMLNAPGRNLAVVLNQAVEEKKFSA